MVKDMVIEGRMRIPEQGRIEVIFGRIGNLYVERTIDIDTDDLISPQKEFEDTPENRIDMLAYRAFVNMCKEHYQ